MAATAEGLANQAEQLQSTIEFFKVDDTIWQPTDQQENGLKIVQPKPAKNSKAIKSKKKAHKQQVELDNTKAEGGPDGQGIDMNTDEAKGDDLDDGFERY